MERSITKQIAQKELLEKFISNYNKDGKARRSPQYYKKRLHDFQALFDKIRKTHTEILMDKTREPADSPHLSHEYFTKDLYDEMEEFYYTKYAEIENRFETEYPKPEPEPQPHVHDDSFREMTTPSKEMFIKLPRISLEKFSGDYQKWTTFHDLFTSLIHENPNLSNGQKLQYLKMHLSGEAEGLLRQVQVTNDNYQPAWKLLVDRYNNKRVLVNTQLKLLFSQPTITSESAQGIKNLMDVTTECLQALYNLGIKVENWDAVIVYTIVQKFPSDTHQLWEQSISKDTSIPSWETLREFMEGRFRTLEAVSQKGSSSSKNYRGFSSRPTVQSFHITNNPTCSYCRSNHNVRQCQRFCKLSGSEKMEFVKSKALCLNCLGHGHLIAQCPSRHTCNICNQRHHSLLHHSAEGRHPKPRTDTSALQISPPHHQNQPQSNTALKQPYGQKDSSPNTSSSNNQACSLHSLTVSSGPKISRGLLATAIVKLRSDSGQEIKVRAVIDPGSEVSIVTESVVQQLNLKREPIGAQIDGVALISAGKNKDQVHLTLKSQYNKHFKLDMKAIVLDKITNLLPSREIYERDWLHLKQLQLADPWYYRPEEIDILLGVNVYGQIIQKGVILSKEGSPIAQKTLLGWILSGEINDTTSSIQVNSFHVTVDLQQQLKKFWELEEVKIENQLTAEEQRCEEHFQKTHKRHPDGRYEVQLPFSEESASLGASRNKAVSCFYQSESRLSKTPELKQQYDECLKEYITLNHMEAIYPRADDDTTEKSGMQFYLPHHSVLKEDSTTTKLRVVFNASAPTSNGVSLNDILLNGPLQQDDLFSILLRWRAHRIAFTADIAKMYRQIRVSKEHADYQRLVWRESPQTPLREYRLLTVTFGTKSAPYLATRVIKQLAIDERMNYPIGSAAAQTEFYVDDLMSGEYTIDAAIEKQAQLRQLMTSGGFQLRKWVSNSQELLKNIPEELREMDLCFNIGIHDNVKALGIRWNPSTDTLSYALKESKQPTTTTKRTILSEISKLFDPLGWLSPVIIIGKILIQNLWLAKIDWDDIVPTEINAEWTKYQTGLSKLDEICIPRWIHIGDPETKIELHGFSDASNKAYAAVIYLCAIQDGVRKVSILTAKTKVSPLKLVSLPRLELCGAVLLAKLLQTTKKALKFPEDTPTFAWTDSEIVLAWLKGHPTKWKTFIANRVSLIHEILGEGVWGHVPTSQNPADCATRGKSPEELKNYDLWWTGPEWMQKPSSSWPTTKPSQTDLEIRKLKPYCAHIVLEEDIFCKFSSLNRLVRVIAYCQRFLNNCKHKSQDKPHSYLTNSEMNTSLTTIIKITQRRHFGEEINNLTTKQEISRKSSLIKLTPFLDINGILRVGGRLKHSLLKYDEKHPIILPDKDHITTLIINNYHKETLHGSTQLMMSVISRKYWILNARNTIRFQIHKCISCHRYKAASQQQLMGDLPQARVRMARPFSHTGLDYCGPIELKTRKGRGYKTYKGYIAIFVCMATKALHIEIVTDLSAQGFILAYRRFVSRRGKCSDIYCDCGSNFVGASRILRAQTTQMKSQLNIDIASSLETEGVNFHFIPPAAPHFGGLWESGVRSTKYHLKRVLGNSILTYEELSTVLTQIEACLNSRPLCEMNSDPEDLTPLTPAHFLIGDTLITPPEPSVLDTNIHRLDRWQYIQHLYQTFWKRWNTEYLTRLQQRPKWTRIHDNIRIGQLVIIKEDNLPPSQWMLGRILEVHPGPDRLIRVVTVKTKASTLKRPISKICLLPIEPGQTE